MRAGVVYIKYSKTSEAAKALEEMNGKSLGKPPGSRPLKVLVASRWVFSKSKLIINADFPNELRCCI